MIEFLVPIRTGIGLNSREHWAARARRAKKERNAVALLFPREFALGFPLDVHLIRVSPLGRPMDSDGLQGALKAVRDEIAKKLLVDDGESILRFTYAQERGKWGVRIRIAERQTNADVTG